MSLAADDFQSILLDDCVRKEMHDIFEYTKVLTIDEKFKTFQNQVMQALDGLTTTISVLHDELKLKDVKVTLLKTENDALQKEVKKLKNSFEELTQ